MLRFKNEFRQEDLIFAFIHQKPAHGVRVLGISVRLKGVLKDGVKCDG